MQIGGSAVAILGHIDVVTATEVKGWAYDSELGGAAATVELIVNGEAVASSRAAEYRQDLLQAGIGDGSHGFTLPLAGVGDVSVRVGDSVLLPPEPKQDAERAGDYWDTMVDWAPRMAPRSRWPESPRIVRDYNHRVCGKEVEGDANRGVIELLKDQASKAIPFNRAISIGCGPGNKEMLLIQEGLVNHFDLVDVSQTLLDQGRQVATSFGISDNVSFIHSYNFETDINPGYDLVYWDSALHHMFDADRAVAWSHKVLKPGGWFVMTDFVGATRFQWSEEVYKIADLIRSSLPEEFFHNPLNPAAPYSRTLHRATLKDMEYDPSEAADSEEIIPAINRHFPDADIRHVGGTVFHMVLNDVLTNIPEDSALLSYLLRLDRNIDIPHFAVALAQKPN